ncbi:hypothetical protein [Streptomyces sp. NPDC048332]|uniref:hypothetical protein n=1 Tax=unclassified Streptomyces TaxID=2593676 RepID=UPI0034231093
MADTGDKARTAFLEHEHRMMAEAMAGLGRPMPPRADRTAACGAGGMVFAGSPGEIAGRVLHLHGLLGHTRQILQMDVGGVPPRDFPRGIELLGTKALPRIRTELATR